MRRSSTAAAAAGCLSLSMLVGGPSARAAFDGPYIGAFIGHLAGDLSTTEAGIAPPPPPPPPLDALAAPALAGPAGPLTAGTASLDGLTGTVAAGYNFSLGRNLMAGVEVDYTFGHQQSTYDGHEWGVNHLVTLRGRLGTKLNERVLVYLTGGLAGAKLDYSGLAVLPAPPAVQSEASAHKWGWTLGGGVEMETEQKVRLRAEALYVSLDRWRFDTPADLYTAQLDAWHFRLGVAVPLQ